MLDAARRGRGGGGLPGTDKKLDRDVAIKVLPAEMAADPERLDQFPARGPETIPYRRPVLLFQENCPTKSRVGSLRRFN